MNNSRQTTAAHVQAQLGQGMKVVLMFCVVLHFCAVPLSRGAEPPKLKAALNAANDSIRLELQGTSGITYSIETSVDLKTWSRAGSGAATNGLFVLQQPLSGTPASRYYRGREGVGGSGGASFPASVFPVADTNLIVTTLVTTNGGSALLYARDGTQFKFTVPPLTLPGAEIVTMTLVTNVGGLPFAQGLVGAVRLEPDGLALWGAGTLEISLPAQLDRRKIASFAADGEGSSFHLTPDRVTTKTVIIPVTRLGVVGSALASMAELQGPTGSPARASDHASRVHASLDDTAPCFPDRDRDAIFYNAGLDIQFQDASQGLAEALTAARQAQPSGQTGDTFDFSAVVESAEASACAIIRDSILPLIEQARGNCQLARVLLSHSLAIERQRQLLGIAENPECPGGLGAFPLCAMFTNCVKEIKECCEMGIRGRGQIEAILGIWRQEQLLGLSCLSQGEVDAAVEACAPGVWTGTLRLKIKGEESQSNPDGGRSELEKIEQEFAGVVTDSVEFELGQTTSASLRVEGYMTSSYESDLIVVTENADGCSGFFGSYHKTEAASGPAAFSVQISTSPGRSPLVTVGSIPDPPLLGTATRQEFERSAALVFRGNVKVCDVRLRSDSSSEPNQVLISGSIFGKPSMVESNLFSGLATLDPWQLRLPGNGTFSWSFNRHKANE